MPGRLISTAERRARLARRHLLGGARGRYATTEVADAVVGLHATDPATVYLSVWARTSGDGGFDLERALYEDRSVVRILGMRRTMFVVTLATAPLLDRACARPLAEGERRRTVKMLLDAGVVADPETWLHEVSGETLTALERLGAATATELTEEVPALATRIPVGEGTRWAGQVGMSTRVLFLLATEGHIVRGRPRGSWLSSRYSWVPTDRWASIPDHPGSDADVAVDLVRRYLARFGPATELDVVWWTGWTKTKTRAALAGAGVESVALEDGQGLVLADDLEEVPAVEPWVALLPALDSTIMGWKQRDWYMGEYGPGLFDSNGNAGPTVWVDGRAVGAWAQLENGEVVWRLLEDVGRGAEEAVAHEASLLGGWVGDRVMPRFPSPLQKSLVTGAG